MAITFHEGVGCQDTRATGVGEDGEAWATRARLFCQNFGHREEVRKHFHAQHAVGAAGGAEGEGEEKDPAVLTAGDAFVTPPGMKTRWADPSDDFEILEVSLPGTFRTALAA